jgi:hypothetical protein
MSLIIIRAAARDKRIAGIMMFLPCVDGAWDKSRWGDKIWQEAKRHRFERKLEDGESAQFWPLTDDEAAGRGGSVLSGDYVRNWSIVAKRMSEQGDNPHFDGSVTLESFWSDFNTRPSDSFDSISCPVLWVMATEDIVCGPLDFTKRLFDKLAAPKDICVLEGEHLAQYFDPGFPKSVEAMLAFLTKYA